MASLATRQCDSMRFLRVRPNLRTKLFGLADIKFFVIFVRWYQRKALKASTSKFLRISWYNSGAESLISLKSSSWKTWARAFLRLKWAYNSSWNGVDNGRWKSDLDSSGIVFGGFQITATHSQSPINSSFAPSSESFSPNFAKTSLSSESTFARNSSSYFNRVNQIPCSFSKCTGASTLMKGFRSRELSEHKIFLASHFANKTVMSFILAWKWLFSLSIRKWSSSFRKAQTSNRLALFSFCIYGIYIE